MADPLTIVDVGADLPAVKGHKAVKANIVYFRHISIHYDPPGKKTARVVVSRYGVDEDGVVVQDPSLMAAIEEADLEASAEMDPTAVGEALTLLGQLTTAQKLGVAYAVLVKALEAVAVDKKIITPPEE